MSMKRSELVDTIRSFLGDGAASIPELRIVRYLNMALDDLVQWRVWRDMITWNENVRCKTDERYVAAPPELMDINSIILVNDASSTNLTYIPAKDYDMKFPRPEHYGTGIPAWITWRGGTFELYPIPDQNYPLRIYGAFWPKPFNIVDDVPCPIGHLDSALIMGAIMYGQKSQLEIEKSLISRKEFFLQRKLAANADGEPSMYTPQYGIMSHGRYMPRDWPNANRYIL